MGGERGAEGQVAQRRPLLQQEAHLRALPQVLRLRLQSPDAAGSDGAKPLGLVDECDECSGNITFIGAK